MIIVRCLIFIGLILLYGATFLGQEKKSRERNASLDSSLPASFHEIAAGYVKQLAAEMLFIRTSVYIGGLNPGTQPASYVEPLSMNLEVMTSLYPRFIDSYYLCQAFLPYISGEAAAKANKIIERGIAVYPKDLILHFFHGSNYLLFMNEPLKAARVFAEASELDNAPPMFAHLAALLSAKGGDVTAGLISLRALLAGEKDEVVRARYQEEIAIFEQALIVQMALNSYIDIYGLSPESLEMLVPEFLQELPEINETFILVYDPPVIRLQRPDPKKRVEKGVPWN